MDILDKIIAFFSGKDKTPIWQQFANEKQGEIKSESGDLFVAYSYSDYNFRIGEFTHYVISGGSSYEKKYMIGMVQFTNPNNFEISITPDDLFRKIGKFFKNNDIKIEHKGFDSKFFIKSNHEFKAITILKDKDLLEKIISADPILLEVTKEKGLFNEHRPLDGKHMLHFAKQEKFKDINQLNYIHLLLSTFIENLKENCSIQN
ncbi:MAG: hypothetical protein V4666_13255 [Bacteroidota bacterium]